MSSHQFNQHIELKRYFISGAVARNLNVAVQLAAVDVRRLMSKMDFRSNEAGRTAQEIETRRCPAEAISARGHIPFR
jgi:hypothetical protein